MDPLKQAKDSLVFYFTQIFNKAGLQFTEDNKSEVEQIIDLTVAGVESIMVSKYNMKESDFPEIK